MIESLAAVPRRKLPLSGHGVLAVVDREAGGRARVEDAGLPVITLVSAKELGLV